MRCRVRRGCGPDPQAGAASRRRHAPRRQPSPRRAPGRAASAWPPRGAVASLRSPGARRGRAGRTRASDLVVADAASSGSVAGSGADCQRGARGLVPQLDGTIRAGPHARDESITVTGDGDDEVVLVGTLAQRTRRSDEIWRARLFSLTAVLGHTRFSSSSLLTMRSRCSREDDEDVERLRRDRHGPAVPPQPALDGHRPRTDRTWHPPRSSALAPCAGPEPSLSARCCHLGRAKSIGLLRGLQAFCNARQQARRAWRLRCPARRFSAAIYSRSWSRSAGEHASAAAYRIAQRPPFRSFHIFSSAPVIDTRRHVCVGSGQQSTAFDEEENVVMQSLC